MRPLCLLLLLGLMISGAEATPTPPATTPPTSTTSADTGAPTPEEIAAAGRWTGAIIHTPRGAITVDLFPATAPRHVANFVKLAQRGFYNGTTFHRVETGFVIQGGDPFTKPGQGAGLPGTGGPGYQIDAEVGPSNPQRHTPGTLAMARSADPNSAGSQFYLTAAATPHLDGGYTVFGRIRDPQALAIITAVRRGDPMRVEILPPATP